MQNLTFFRSDISDGGCSIISQIMGEPKYLYKFRSFSNPDHKRMLTENELYFSSPNNLNDPFDSSIPIRYDLCGDKEANEKAFRYQMDLLTNEYPELDTKELTERAKEYFKFIYEHPKEVEEAAREISRELTTEIGVFSLCKDYRNILLWSLYADKHRGFCVGFSTKKLLKFFLSNFAETAEGISLERVHYSKRYPLINAYTTTEAEKLRCLTTKASTWKHEREYRLIMVGFPNRPFKIDYGIVKSLILGCGMRECDKNEVISIVKSRPDRISLYQARMKKDDFGLDFDRIDIDSTEHLA